ncbi:hypothetical protein C8R44DRAFT_744668 [Mycena epipterygia]|nr:hypothetical protein C8R44DRAFT_744668 [Mycena epipterygia]
MERKDGKSANMLLLMAQWFQLDLLVADVNMKGHFSCPRPPPRLIIHAAAEGLRGSYGGVQRTVGPAGQRGTSTQNSEEKDESKKEKGVREDARRGGFERNEKRRGGEGVEKEKGWRRKSREGITGVKERGRLGSPRVAYPACEFHEYSRIPRTKHMPPQRSDFTAGTSTIAACTQILRCTGDAPAPKRESTKRKHPRTTEKRGGNKGGNARTNEEREADVRTKNVERERTGSHTPSATEEGEEESGVRRNAERTGKPQTSHLLTPYRRGMSAFPRGASIGQLEGMDARTEGKAPAGTKKIHNNYEPGEQEDRRDGRSGDVSSHLSTRLATEQYRYLSGPRNLEKRKGAERGVRTINTWPSELDSFAREGKFGRLFAAAGVIAPAPAPYLPTTTRAGPTAYRASSTRRVGSRSWPFLWILGHRGAITGTRFHFFANGNPAESLLVSLRGNPETRRTMMGKAAMDRNGLCDRQFFGDALIFNSSSPTAHYMHPGVDTRSFNATLPLHHSYCRRLARLFHPVSVAAHLHDSGTETSNLARGLGMCVVRGVRVLARVHFVGKLRA